MSDRLRLGVRLEPAADRGLVLVVVGTDVHPFDRLMRWVDDCTATSDRGVGWLVQSGTSAPPANVPASAYLSHGELEEAMGAATTVVCHGGPGAIADARSAGHVPVVVPRVAAFGEHVDDHQVRFARRLAGAGHIRLAEDEERFRVCLGEALAAPERRAAGVAARRERRCDRFIALADRLLEEPPRGLVASLLERRGGRAA